jgi:Protein of unknown function (DUF3866)
MIQWSYGYVLHIDSEFPGVQWLKLLTEETGEIVKGVCYTSLYGSCSVGEKVALNQTARQLGLGTGGIDYVVRLSGLPGEKLRHKDGHIIKLRYTPIQLRVQAVEEESHPAHPILKNQDSLAGCPVIVAELHSMVPVITSVLRYRCGEHIRIAYIMTDGGALAAAFSKTIDVLKQKGLLAGVVTIGNAFGGDLEAVNLYSGLLAARHVLRADIIIVAMGPGIVGTNTQYGHSGIEQGIGLNAVHTLQGQGIPVLRCSGADPRLRHQGISHHTITSLTRVSLVGGTIGIPELQSDVYNTIWNQILTSGLNHRYQIIETGPSCAQEAGAFYQIQYQSMGRKYEDDPLFFDMAAAAAEVAVLALESKNSCSVALEERN